MSKAVKNIALEGLTRECASYWLREKVKAENVKIPNKGMPKFEAWQKRVTEGLSDGLVWETIESIKEVEQEEISLEKLSQNRPKKKRKGKKKETFNDFINRLIDEDLHFS